MLIVNQVQQSGSPGSAPEPAGSRNQVSALPAPGHTTGLPSIPPAPDFSSRSDQGFPLPVPSRHAARRPAPRPRLPPGRVSPGPPGPQSRPGRGNINKIIQKKNGHFEKFRHKLKIKDLSKCSVFCFYTHSISLKNIDPCAQALLTMMRGQHPASARPQVTPDPASEAESPAKRQRRNSSCLEAEDSEAPVSPPPSSIPQQVERSCRSECSVSQACSEEGRRIISWSVDQVVDFISNIDDVKEHAEAFAREKIDGSTLVLLTDSHLTSLGIKLGPAIRLR